MTVLYFGQMEENVMIDTIVVLDLHKTVPYIYLLIISTDSFFMHIWYFLLHIIMYSNKLNDCLLLFSNCILYLFFLFDYYIVFMLLFFGTSCIFLLFIVFEYVDKNVYFFNNFNWIDWNIPKDCPPHWPYIELHECYSIELEYLISWSLIE